MNKTRFKIPYEHKIPIGLGTDKAILQKLEGIELIIAGGSVVTSVQHSIGKLASKNDDIDLFFLNDTEFKKGLVIFQKSSTLLYDSKYSWSFQFNGKKYQLIKPSIGNYNNFKELIDDFDLNNSKWFSIYPFSYGYSRESLQTLHHISIGNNNKIFDDNINYNVLERILKYIDQKKMDWPRSSRDQQLIADLILYDKDEYYNKSNMDYKSVNTFSTKEELKNDQRNQALFRTLKQLQTNRTDDARNILTYIIYKESSGIMPDVETFARMQTANGNHIDDTGIQTLDYFLMDEYLSQDFEESKHGFAVLNFSIGPRLENKDYQKSVRNFMKKTYPEVIL